MMQDESIDLSNNNNNNLDKLSGSGKRSRRSSSVNSYSESFRDFEGDGSLNEDPVSSDNYYDYESTGTGAGIENEESTEGSCDNKTSNQPEVKVKTLVEYHLEFLTKHPGEVFFYGCKLCTNRFTSRNSFLIHMKLHNVRKRYPCQHCDKAYDRKFQLVHHLKLHTEETPFECGVCFVAYATEAELIDHSKIHRSEKPFECRYCLKGFPQKKALIVHLRMHTGERPFHCPLCERTFTQKAHLRGHMVRIHIPKNKDTNFKSAAGHTSTDTATLSQFNIYSQKLNLGSRTDEPQDLSNHSETKPELTPSEIDLSILSGQREKLIECDFCDKKFTYERNKINHMRKHGYVEGVSGNSMMASVAKLSNSNNISMQAYQCGLCQMSFPSTNLLMTHILSHSGNNMLSNFSSSSNLPFHCDICGRDFNMKRNLIMHVKSHNNERPHQCPACEKSFKLKYFLELHVSKIHPHINVEDIGKKSSQTEPADDEEEEEVEQMDFTGASEASSVDVSSLEKENATLNLSSQPAPNKRKQSQPKKVIMRTDLYETDSDTSYGEPYTDGSDIEEDDTEMMEYYEDDVESMTSVERSFHANNFTLPLNLQRQPKIVDNSDRAKSMQINLPHDLHHVKNILNSSNSKALVDNKEQTSVSCPVCFIVVSSKAALALHVKDHEKNKTHQCPKCEKVYIQQASFEKHMKKHMLDEIAARQTKMIEQATRSSKPPDYHDQQSASGRFEGRKPLECNICRKKYAQPASFEKHMRLHSELADVALMRNDNMKQPLDNFKTNFKSVGLSISKSSDKSFVNPSEFLEVSINH